MGDREETILSGFFLWLFLRFVMEVEVGKGDNLQRFLAKEGDHDDDGITT